MAVKDWIPEPIDIPDAYTLTEWQKGWLVGPIAPNPNNYNYTIQFKHFTEKPEAEKYLKKKNDAYILEQKIKNPEKDQRIKNIKAWDEEALARLSKMWPEKQVNEFIAWIRSEKAIYSKELEKYGGSSSKTIKANRAYGKIEALTSVINGILNCINTQYINIGTDPNPMVIARLAEIREEQANGTWDPSRYCPNTYLCGTYLTAEEFEKGVCELCNVLFYKCGGTGHPIPASSFITLSNDKERKTPYCLKHANLEEVRIAEEARITEEARKRASSLEGLRDRQILINTPEETS